jgi:hypothetical protein
VSEETGTNVGAGVTDISAEGMGVRLTESMVTGDELQVSINTVDGRPVLAIRGKVRWCRPIRSGLFAVGLRFPRPLTLTELAELVA